MKKLSLIAGLVLLGISVSAQAWIQRTNFSGTGRHRASGFSIGNYGYIGSGHVNGNNFNISYKDWWKYDPSSDSWTQIADFPVYTYGATVFATSANGYVGGGAGLNSEFYKYEPVTNSWTAIQNCPVSPGDQPGFSVNDKGYVFSGTNFYEYDPLTGNWTQKQSTPVAFAGWCATFSMASSGYVKSGSLLYEYKPLYNQWVQKASFPGVSTNGSGFFVRNGRGYIVCGFVGSLTNVTHEVWEYNPGSNSWTRLNDFPGSSRRFSVGFTINNRGYMGTGTNGINFDDFWEMDDAVFTAEYSGETQISIYPNPADEQVHLRLNKGTGENCLVRLYDATGKLIEEVPFGTDEALIGRKDKTAGMYIGEIVREGKVLSREKIFFR